MRSKRKLISFRPEDDLLELLKAAAKREGRSVNNLMNRYLKERLDEEEKKAV